MEKGTTYVALDDSKRKIVAGILRSGAPTPELRELPNDPHHIRRLFERLKREGPVVACYEAGVSGYDLYRQITALEVPCQVMAPALTPRRPGQRIKTDRRDAGKLVHLFRADELTAIHVPAEPEEAVRDLVRCRDDVRRDVMRWRHRLLKLLDRHGRVYPTGKNWSRGHWAWIRAQRFDLPALQRAFAASLFALEQALAGRAELDKEIEAIAETAPYRTPVGWLRCFRGIDTLSAMILLVEVVDFQRFDRPRQLMAYLGLVPSEDSSGDTRRRGALTKAGNTHVRRVLVEAAWPYRHRPSLGRALAARSHGQPADVVSQAWRAQQRLHRRYRHLVGHGKRPPVAAAAIARELVGFIWAVMTRRESPPQAA
ncbi:MAG: IS110 family transposase [Actinobacteria bacterium]|nr:IS110 family transposase [Actinomycetota bacterium]